MSENVIFCFSGSGNCLNIAKTIAAELGDTDIIMMRKAPSITDVSEAKTVGFVFPCHGGGMPVGLEDKISSLNIGHKPYTYGILSYSGYVGNGLSILNKHVPLDYWNTISHHCSCIWLLPHSLMLPKLSVEKAQERSEKLAKAMASDIKNRVRFYGKVPENALNAVESKYFPAIATKKASAFTVDSSKCIGCGQCSKICPNNNITMSGGKPNFGKDCISCLSCVQFCPKGAIDVGNITKKRERYHNIRITAQDLMQDIIHVD